MQDPNMLQPEKTKGSPASAKASPAKIDFVSNFFDNPTPGSPYAGVALPNENSQQIGHKIRHIEHNKTVNIGSAKSSRSHSRKTDEYDRKISPERRQI